MGEVEVKGRSPLIVAISGRLDSLNAQRVKEEMERILSESDEELVLDFSNLSYISSAGLQVVLLCIKNRQAKGKSVKVLGASGIVDEVLRVSGFYSFLEKV